MIAVKDLTYDYPNGFRALHGVSFSIGPGQVTALVGPNGSGKTTLLRCLAALDTPLEGSITVDNIDVLQEPRLHHRNLGYLSDFFGLTPALTVTQSLQFAGASRSIDEASLPGRLAETLELLDLTEYASRRVSELSRGLRQRTGIGMAIIHRPNVLLLDEPASGLDPEARIGLSQLMLRLQRSGISILVSSHILAELEDYSTEMLILRKGQVVEHAPLANAPALAGTQSGIWMELTLAQGLDYYKAEQLASLLNGLPGVSQTTGIAPEGLADKFRFHLQEQAQAAGVLAALMSAGYGITSFAPIKTDMQQSYLDTLNRISRS